MATRSAFCSFCRKNYRDVGPLVEGPGDVYICGECVELCQMIIAQEKRRRQHNAGEAPAWPDASTVRAKLDRLGTLPADTSEVLVQAAIDHYAGAGHDPLNVLLLVGPTRSSRLCAAWALAHALKVPFAEANADLVTGPTLALVVFDKLLRACHYEIELAERGIIYLDDADDPATQARVVELWEQIVRDPIDHRLKIDLARLFFICGGTFANVTTETGITKVGRDPDPAIAAEALGMAPALARRVRFAARAPTLDEAAVARLVPYVDFARLTGDDDPRTDN